MLPASITDPLTLYLDEDVDRAALDEACAAAKRTRFDITELFDWVQHYAADNERKRRAQIALRGALGLPLIPGPPCRSG